MQAIFSFKQAADISLSDTHSIGGPHLLGLVQVTFRIVLSWGQLNLADRILQLQSCLSQTFPLAYSLLLQNQALLSKAEGLLRGPVSRPETLLSDVIPPSRIDSRHFHAPSPLLPPFPASPWKLPSVDTLLKQ